MKRRDLLKTSIAGIGTLAFAPAARAVEHYLQASAAKKWAIIYSTWCGSSKDAATWMAEGMGNSPDILDVKTKPKVSDYDFIVIGGAIHAGKTSSELQSYITTNKAALKTKIRGSYIVCGNGGVATISDARKKELLNDHLLKLCEVTDQPSIVFPGRFKADCAENASLLSSMKEYDNIKKEDCVAFGKTIDTGSTSILDHGKVSMNGYQLTAISPNPVNTRVAIHFNVPVTNSIKLSVCSLDGTKLGIITEGQLKAGTHTTFWNTSNVAAGMYLIKLEAENCVLTQKVWKITQ